MKKSVDHTFIILAYKKSPFLEKCILSLKAQTVNSKVILSTSTPSLFLKQITEKYNISYVINEEKRGIAFDWSFAYNNCKTRYLTLVHQDDIYYPEYTEYCISALGKNTECLIAFSDYNELREGRYISYNLNLIIKKLILYSIFLFKNNISSKFLKKLLLSFGSPICCPSVMYNKKIIGSFKFDSSFNINLDWEAWIRLGKIKGRFRFIKKRLIAHRIHRDSATASGIQNKGRWDEDKKIFNRLWPRPVAWILSSIYRLSYKSN